MSETMELIRSCEMHANIYTVPSDDTNMYLRGDAKLEPLVQRWYAWPHLIAPVQHALNVTFRHLDLMRSFAMSPTAHIAANLDPSLFGGPFLALKESDGPALKALMRHTVAKCADHIAFAKALRSLPAFLAEHANGSSLMDLYSMLPPSLSGLVELAYDLDNNPCFRVLEELVYHQFETRRFQEIRLVPEREIDRTFFMNTPRLARPDEVSLQMPFSDPRIDLLASMRTVPTRFGSLIRTFDLPRAALPRLAACLTTVIPTRDAPHFAGSGVRIRYFGHACVLVQTATTAVLFDPMLSVEGDHADGRLTLSDLPDTVDCVVLSHNHQDHCCPEMLLQIRHKVKRILVPRNNTGNVADPSMKLILRELGYSDIEVLDSFDEVVVGDCRIQALPFVGEHADLDIAAKQSIFLRAKGVRLLFLVDSDGTGGDVYGRVARQLGGPMDAVFLGMECQGAPLSWLYGPLLQKPIGRKHDESRRLSGANCERALKMLNTFRTKRAFVYAMGQEPWLKYTMGLEYRPDSVQLNEVRRFISECGSVGIQGESLHIRAEITLPEEA